MNEDARKQDQLLATTDYLEAVGTIKTAKNFFFIVIILCLIVLQSCFWLTKKGYIDPAAGGNRCVSDSVCGLFQLAVSADTPADSNEPAAITEAKKAEIIEKAAADVAAEPNSAGDQAEAEAGRAFKINFSQAEWLVRFFNFVLVFSSIAYLLTILFAIKISLIGKLGGISHITRSFYLAMFAFIFMMPWQLAFDGVIYGAVYTPAELMEICTGSCDAGIYRCIVLIGRYTGLWAIVLVLIIAAHTRSMKWSRNILKRLGIAG